MKQHMKQYNTSRCTIKIPITLFSFTWIIISLFFVFATSPTLATGDDYLSVLENKAGNAAPSKKVSTADNYLDALSTEAEASAHVPTNTGNAGPSKEQLALEKLLKKEKPTTFKYYKKLNHWDKATVVELYRTDNADTPTKFDHLRKKILDLYFKR